MFPSSNTVVCIICVAYKLGAVGGLASALRFCKATRPLPYPGIRHDGGFRTHYVKRIGVTMLGPHVSVLRPGTVAMTHGKHVATVMCFSYAMKCTRGGKAHGGLIV